MKLYALACLALTADMLHATADGLHAAGDQLSAIVRRHA